ncbi:MAG TPA: hypothetical protein VER03_08900 [Bryobacteraceae bacterium]|nr:hypothetical protein [Bryobacteraceae bacterium]
MDGARGLLEVLGGQLRRKAHAVIVVAEGAGQHLMPQGAAAVDASGNKLHADIGVLLRDGIWVTSVSWGVPVNVRYIDPSYSIRGLAANAGRRHPMRHAGA